MQVSFFWPTFQALPDPDGLTLKDASTGLVHRINGRAAPDAANAIAPFASRTLAEPFALQPVPTALAFEDRFFRKSGAPPRLLGRADVVPKNSSSDWHDDSRGSHETGGARRRLVSMSLARHRRGLADGLAALKSYAADQDPRPVGHALSGPWSYNGYWGQPADGWKYDQQQADSWSVFDPAHLEVAHLYGGAIAGEGRCAAQLVALALYVANTFPGGGAHGVQQGWRGSDQERAVGEMLVFYARLAMLGVGMGPSCSLFRDTYLGGLDPKQHLVGLLKDLVTRPPPWGAGRVDVNTLPDVGAYAGRPELQGTYGWQRGMLHWGAEYVLASGLVNEPLRSQTIAWLRPQCTEFVRRAVGAGGVAFAFTRHDDFGDLTVALANQRAKPGFVYELAYRGDLLLGPIRSTPRLADSEVSAAGLYLAGFQAEGRLIAKLHPDPDLDPDGFAKVATYLDPIYAAEGR